MLTVFICDPWAALEAQLIAECEQQQRDHERELDLQRQQELYPETEAIEPEAVPAELVLGWDAYRGARTR